jgi:glycine cleavage system H lipoate-binding protein
MLPGVAGFEWTAGHLIFLGVFFSVLIVIAATVAMVSIRVGRDRQTIDQLRWQSTFHDLPKRDRACRHELTGEFKQRTCKLNFDCRQCDTHKKVLESHPVAPGEADIFGMHFPLDRMYHRGHTWARTEEDGSVTVGLDDLGRRLVGLPDMLELPAVGSSVEVNGTAWRMRKSGAAVRVPSPVDGIVLATGDPESDWRLKVKPTNIRTAHLLRGAETKAWIRRELEKLQLLTAGAGASLADGGVMVEDMSLTCPKDKWDDVLAGMFLES